MQVSIVADVREKESRLFDALRKLDVRIERRRLPVADYLAGAALVERRSVRDLHLAIIQGRFWPQPGRLSRTPLRPHLLVEVAELGIGVIRSSGPADSALWLKIPAGRQQRRRRVTRAYAQHPAPSEAAEAMLAAVPGISTVTAQALLQRFGSVAAVIEAGLEEWLSIHGVGPKKVQAISETLAPRERHV